MKICWLVAHEKLESNPAEPKLTEAVERAGISLIKAYDQNIRSPLRYDHESVASYDIVIAHGPIPFIKQLEKTIPNKLYNFGFSNRTNFNTFTANLREFDFLNGDYIIIPYGLINDNLPGSMRNMRLFVRPNSGFKPFTGFVLPWQNDKRIKMLDDMAQTQKIAPDELCIIAPERDIRGEFRFVICRNEVIASSQYF